MKNKKSVLFLILIVSNSSFAQTVWKGSIAKFDKLSPSESTGPLPQLIRTLFKATDNELKLKVNPFSRSLNSTIKGENDFHFPIIKGDINPGNLIFSDATAYYVTFDLIFHKDDPIDLNELKKGSSKIDTELSHVGLFGLAVNGVTCITCSLKSLNARRLDGVLYPKFLIEDFVKREKLNNIKSVPYKQFEVKFVLNPKTDVTKLNELLSRGLNEIKKNGKLKQILNGLVETEPRR